MQHHNEWSEQDVKLLKYFGAMLKGKEKITLYVELTMLGRRIKWRGQRSKLYVH